MSFLEKGNSRKKRVLISVGVLLIFTVIGQILINQISMESELSQDWEYDAYFPIHLVTVAVTVIVAGLIYLAVRYFPVKKKLQKLIAYVLGIALSGWMLFCAGFSIWQTTASLDVYEVAGLWQAYVDRLEEERKIWNKSHWAGHGDEVYKYSYDEFKEAQRHLHLGNEENEAYRSIVDERYKMEYVFRYCESETMINVLCYFYGKWVWLLYLSLTLYTLTSVALMLPSSGTWSRKLMFLVAWALFAIITLLPALNGCALVFDPIAGPICSGIGWYYWLFGALLSGPAIGTVLGLTDRKKASAWISENF